MQPQCPRREDCEPTCDRARLLLKLYTPAPGGLQVLKGCIRSLRNARAEYNVEPGRKIGATLVVEDEATRKVRGRGRG
jgi:hypothetical protein